MEPQLNPEEAAPELAQRSASSDTNGGEKLPMSIKLAYGMPNLAGAGMAIPIAIHMNIFYSDVVLVPLGYIALAVALARSFDAITDPLMGWISDRTRDLADEMMRRYDRGARMLTGLQYEPFPDLGKAIPELSKDLSNASRIPSYRHVRQRQRVVSRP